MDWTRGGRTDSFRYVRVAWPSFEELGELPWVTACTVEENDLAELKVTGTLSYAGDMAGLGDDMVRVYSTSELGGESETVCHATLLASATSSRRSPQAVSVRASLYSVLKVLQDEVLEGELTVAQGSDPVEWCARACRERSLPVSAAVPSGVELSEPASFDPGTSVLSVVNALLDAAGYGSAGVSTYGEVTMAPYEDPQHRAVRCTVSESDAGSAIVDAGYSQDLDRSGVYNVVTVEGTDGDGEAIRATARNDSPSSLWSTVTRGRTVSRHETVAEPTTAEALERKARLMLSEATTRADRVTFSHFWADFELGDAILVDFPGSGVSDRYTAVKRTCRMVPGMRCETVARRFVDLEVEG